MKGSVLGLETIVSIVGVLVAAVLLFLFVSPVAFDQLKDSFCLSTGFCGERVSIYTSVAKQSVDALACAVSSTAEGQKLPCVEKFEENQPDGPYVACSTQEQLVCCDTGWFGGEYWMTKDLCQASKYSVVGGDKCGDLEWFSEKRTEAPKFSCVVRNFNLPQTLGEATIPLIGVKFTPEKWIEGYGDPQYLVYYQRFPAEEDTWSFKADWKVYTLIVVTTLPPGKIAKFLGKAWQGIRTSKLFGTGAGKVGEQLLLFESKQGGVQAINRIADPRNAINFIKGTLQALKKARIATEGGIKRVKRLAVISGAVVAADWLEGEEYETEYVESVLAKLNPEAGKLVLKMPLAKPIPFELSKELEGKPVLIQFRPKIAKREKQLHLVSPCKLDVLPVFKEATECPSYLFNGVTGYTECSLNRVSGSTPTYPNRLSKLSDSDLPLCQGIVDDYKFTENPASNTFIDFFRSLKGSSRPSILENYFEDGIFKIPFFKDVVYEATSGVNFSSDKILISVPNKEEQISISTETNGYYPDSFPFLMRGIAEGKVSYKDSDIKVYKFCFSWLNRKDTGTRGKYTDFEATQKENEGELPKFDCQIGIKVDKTCSDTNDPVCQVFDTIKSEPEYTEYFKPPAQSKGIDVNHFTRSIYYNELKEDGKVEDSKINQRIMFISGSGYSIGLIDSDYGNNINQIDFYSKSLSEPGELAPTNPATFIADVDFDGTFESYGTRFGCKSEAVFADLVDSVKGGDTNYCVSESGLGWGIAEGVGYYGGWTLVAVGSTAAIVGTGGLATPLVGGLAAGTFITAGFTAISLEEISDLTGGWPDN